MNEEEIKALKDAISSIRKVQLSCLNRNINSAYTISVQLDESIDILETFIYPE